MILRKWEQIPGHGKTYQQVHEIHHLGERQLLAFEEAGFPLDLRSREWMEREICAIRGLLTAGIRLLEKDTLSELLEQSLAGAIAITHADMGTVHLVDGENGGALRLFASNGFPTEVRQQLDMPSSGQFPLPLARSLMIDFPPPDPAPIHVLLAGCGVRAAQWMPLFSQAGCLLGVLATYWRFSHQPRQSDLRLLDLLARQVGHLVEHRQSEATLRDLSENLERRVAQRTAELQEQTSRLQSLAAELASAEQRERKRLAALLHDDLQQLLVAAGMQLGLARRLTGTAAATAVTQAQKWVEEARIAAGDLTRELRPPALYEDGLVAALHWLATEMLERHHVAVRIDGHEPSQSISEDIRAMLFECVRELLFNVVKYAGVTSATVSLYENGGLNIVVSDAGAGFDVNAAGTSGQRAGFGLFSIRERLFALGGTMTILSTPGNGCRIDLHVPLADAGDQPGPSCKPTAHPSTAGGTAHSPVNDPRIQVLLVDDHPLIREGISRILGADPRLAVCGEACDGLEAIQHMELYLPDVVLMDVNMPRMNGIEATREICRRWPDVRIIGLSVQDDPAIAKSMCDAGARAFISKSVASDSMVATIIAQRPVLAGTAVR